MIHFEGRNLRPHLVYSMHLKRGKQRPRMAKDWPRPPGSSGCCPARGVSQLGAVCLICSLQRSHSMFCFQKPLHLWRVLTCMCKVDTVILLAPCLHPEGAPGLSLLRGGAPVLSS